MKRNWKYILKYKPKLIREYKDQVSNETCREYCDTFVSDNLETIKNRINELKQKDETAYYFVYELNEKLSNIEH